MATKTKKTHAAKTPKLKVVKTPIVQTKCLCGCGQLAAKRRLFKQGHDSKLRHKAVATLSGKEKHTFTTEQLAFLKSAEYVTRGDAEKIA